MDGLQQQGRKLLYDPRFIALRRPRATLPAFCRMLMTYGRGRAEQFRLHPTAGSALNLAPPLFCVYLALTPALAWRWPLGLWPLAVYALAVLAQTAVSMMKHGLARALLAAPLMVVSHICYGLGFWRGLFTALKKAGDKPATGVTLETIRLAP